MLKKHLFTTALLSATALLGAQTLLSDASIVDTFKCVATAVTQRVEKTTTSLTSLKASQKIVAKQAADSEYTLLQTIDFEDADTYDAGWTFGGGVTHYQGLRGESHFISMKENMKGDRDNTFDIANTRFLGAEQWKMEFDWAAYSSNANESFLQVKGDNELGQLFRISVGSWSVKTASVKDADGNDLLTTLPVDVQDKNTRGQDIAVSTWHHIILEASADKGVLLTMKDAEGNVELDAAKVCDFAHATGFNLHLGKALAQMAIDDVQLSMVIVPTWVEVGRLDFEDADTYDAGWTFGGGVTHYQGLRGESHFISMKENMKGDRDNTYTIANTRFIGADQWKMDFDWAAYSSNTNETYLQVKGDNELGQLFRISIGSWAAIGTVQDADGNALEPTIAVDAQNKNTRGQDIAVTIWYHITLDASADKGVLLTIKDAADSVLVDAVKVCDFAHATGFNLHLGKSLAQMAIDDVVMSIFTAEEVIDAPTIKVEGETYGSNLVTINAAAGLNILYTYNGGEVQTYAAPFRVYESGTLVAWAAKDNGSESEKTTRDIVAGEIATPTSTITGVKGGTRTITLACTTAGTSIEYFTDSLATEGIAYTEPFELTQTTVLRAVASYTEIIDNDTTTFVSDTLSTTIEAGAEVQLTPVAYAKVSYDEATTLAEYTLTADQSKVLCTPTVTIHYTLPDGTTGTCDNGASLKDLPLGLLKAYASAEGYKDSEESHIWLKKPAKLEVDWSIDFDSISGQLALADKTAPVLLPEVLAHENGLDFVGIQIADSIINNNFGVQAGTNWLMRSDQASRYDTIYSTKVDEQGVEVPDTIVNKTVYTYGKGLYQFNGGGRSIAIMNVKRNQVVKIFVDDRMNGGSGEAANDFVLYDNGVAAVETALCEPDTIAYRVTANGNIVLSMTRYKTIHTVTVYDDPSVTSDVDFAVVRCDGASRFVELSSRTEGADIFYSIADNPTDTILTWGEYMPYTGALEFKDVTVLRAYATFQDVISGVTTFTVNAGQPIQLAQPVIKYVGTTEAGNQFEITVNNKNVESQPESEIYYILPGGKETLYEGTITVPASTYGWMTVVAKKAGYTDSPLAYRYVDARKSYNEVYEAVVAETTVMPTEAADIEFADAPTINVAQEAALIPTGRIYYHRTMHAGLNNVVLPFNMTTANLASGAVCVTDASGKVLERGADYKVVKLAAPAADATSIDATTEYTGNLVGNSQSYLISVAEDLVGQDLIFVSLEKQSVAVAQNTFAQPASGWKFINNKRFQALTLEFPVYLLNAAGTAFDRVEVGTVIPAFTTVLVGDETLTSTVQSLPVTQTITGLNAIESMTEAGVVYDAQGRKVAAPVRGQVYIQNGKKFIQK